MTEATTLNENEKPTWKDVAAASAEAQRPGDPKPRPFTEKLDCKLTERERINLAVRFADTSAEVTARKAALKTYNSERKAEISKLEASANEFADAVRTGRVKREVSCVEHISFAQNRKWSVRLDTSEEFNEQALSAEDRQVLLVPEDKEDGQLTLAEIGSPDLDATGEARAVDADSTTNLGEDGADAVDVTNPGGVLAGEMTDPNPKGSPPPKEPTRRGNRSK